MTPSDLISEDVVMERYGNLFGKRELKQARNDGLIGYFELKTGIFYTDADLMAYLQRNRRECQKNARLDSDRETPDARMSSGIIGSTESQETRSGTTTGTTRNPVELAARRLERVT
jgi:hypothetical protein